MSSATMVTSVSGLVGSGFTNVLYATVCPSAFWMYGIQTPSFFAMLSGGTVAGCQGIVAVGVGSSVPVMVGVMVPGGWYGVLVLSARVGMAVEVGNAP